MCVVQYKSVTDRNVLYVVTDAGVFVKTVQTTGLHSATDYRVQ